jgi:adenylate cyclase
MATVKPDLGTDPAGRTFIFIDLAGFTAMTEAMSDDDAADVVARFCEIAREALGSEDRLVKSIGDAVMLVSPTPATGLQLVTRTLDLVAGETSFPLPRAGLHHGPAAERDGDFFGAAVNLAARVAGQAHGGQVLATISVADTARQRNLRVVDLGSFRLRSVADELDLYEIHVGPSVEGGAIDPVCRMRVERDVAAGRLRHQEVDYWFCSLKCAALFAAAPVSYVQPQA